MLRSSHQFYKWYSELAVVRREQVQGEYAEYLETLTNRLRLTQEITGRVDGSLAALDGLQSDHTGVVAKVRRAATLPALSRGELALLTVHAQICRRCLRKLRPMPGNAAAVRLRGA